MSAQIHSKEWFDEQFTANVPGNLRRLSERLCRSYGINGICDPEYIANVVAVELGLGDGQSNFGDRSTWQRCERETLGADDLIKPCVLTVNHAGFCDTGR